LSQNIKQQFRAALIEKSIKCRALKLKDETIFVNILTPTRSICFSCKEEQIKYELKVPAFDLMPLIIKIDFSQNEDKRITVTKDRYFIKDQIQNNTFIGELNDGTIVRHPMLKLQFEYIFPTTSEYFEIITKNMEEF